MTWELSKYYGVHLVHTIAAQTRSRAGLIGPLAEPNATLWPFIVRETATAIAYDAIPGHSVRRLTPAEVQQTDYTGDKSLATFFEMVFPGSIEPDAFAMRPLVTIAVFAGVTQANMQIVSQPFRIKRISKGDETLIEAP